MIYREFNPHQPDFEISSNVFPIWEYDYLDLLHRVLKYGNDRMDRTGTGTRALFREDLSIDLKQGFPLITTKKMGLKTVIAELIWFLEGSGDERRLAELTHGTRDETKTTIWTANAHSDYWAERGFKTHDGDLGRIYGVQWRDWVNQFGDSIDQIKRLDDKLANDPFDRRMIVSAWNPGEFDRMALPPCHAFTQFFVRVDNAGVKHLSCSMYMRSSDVFLGVPFNIASYAAMTHMLAAKHGMEVDRLEMSFGDCHIYANHFDQVQEQLTRIPHKPPTLNPLRADVTDIAEYTIGDFTLSGYQSHETIKAPMAV